MEIITVLHQIMLTAILNQLEIYSKSGKEKLFSDWLKFLRASFCRTQTARSRVYLPSVLTVTGHCRDLQKLALKTKQMIFN
jgi:hypothetical protein